MLQPARSVITVVGMSSDPAPAPAPAPSSEHQDRSAQPDSTRADPQGGNPEAPRGEFVAIEIQSAAPKGALGFPVAKSLENQEEDGDEQEICRVCHLSLRRDSGKPTSSPNDASGGEVIERFGKGMEAIELGCGCRESLAFAHRRCAETWFKIKGNRICEICGKQAQNVGAPGYDEEYDAISCGRRSDDQSDSEYNEQLRAAGDDEVRRFWHHRPICNFVLAFIVVILLLPWLFRIRLF